MKVESLMDRFVHVDDLCTEPLSVIGTVIFGI